MPTPDTKRVRRPRLSVDPAEHYSRLKMLAASESRATSYIIVKLANERLDQLVTENQVPLDKAILISPNGNITTLDKRLEAHDIERFLQRKFLSKLLPDGRKLLYTSSKKPINVRASLILDLHLAGPVIIGPEYLLPK